MDSSSTSMAKCHIWNGWEQCFDPPNDSVVLRVSPIANSFKSISMVKCYIWNGWEQCFDPPNAVLRVSSIVNDMRAQC